MTLGEFVKSYRKSHGMSQRSFAEFSNISNQYISLLEKGVNNDGKPLSPTMSTFSKIADAVGIPINDFLGMLSGNVTISILEKDEAQHNRSSESIASSLDQLSDNQLDDLFMQLISGKDKDYLLRLAAKILEMASQK